MLCAPHQRLARTRRFLFPGKHSAVSLSIAALFRRRPDRSASYRSLSYQALKSRFSGAPDSDRGSDAL